MCIKDAGLVHPLHADGLLETAGACSRIVERVCTALEKATGLKVNTGVLSADAPDTACLQIERLYEFLKVLCKRLKPVCALCDLENMGGPNGSVLNVVTQTRNLLALLLLLPEMSPLVEEAAPGSTVVLYPYLAEILLSESHPERTSLVSEDYLALLFILSSRLLRTMALGHAARRICHSGFVVEAVGASIERWGKCTALFSAGETTLLETGRQEVELLLCQMFQALAFSIEEQKVETYVFQKHLTSGVFYYAFQILQNSACHSALRCAALAYIASLLKFPSGHVEELIDRCGLGYAVREWCVAEMAVGLECFPALGNRFLKALVLRSPSVDVLSLVASKTEGATVLETAGSLGKPDTFGVPALNLWLPVANASVFDGVVETQGSHIILRQLLLGCVSGSPCLLVGPPGSGKSFYIQVIFSAMRGFVSGSSKEAVGYDEELLWLYLDEEVDSKTLLGTWESGETPGEFVWKDGVLVRALKRGRWVVFENIDTCNPELQVKLQEIVENRSLYVPERNCHVKASEGFALFGTCSSSAESARTSSGRNVPKLLKDWRIIVCPSLQRQEVARIAKARFPQLKVVLPCIEEAFVAVKGSRLYQLNRGSFRDVVGVAEFFKLCRRVEGELVSSGQLSRIPLLEVTRLSLLEIFYQVRRLMGNRKGWKLVPLVLSAITTILRFRIGVCMIFGKSLALTREQVYAVLHQRPAVKVLDEAVVIGEVSVSRLHFVTDIEMCAQKRMVLSGNAALDSFFSYTGVHARVLLATVKALMHQEPVLLVGDTGCGKTTLVQHLAGLFRKNVVVYNFNEQSETADLVGRTIPEDATSLIQRFRTDFLVTVERLEPMVTAGQRSELLSRLDRRIVAGDWRGVLALAVKVVQRLTETIRGSIFVGTVGDKDKTKSGVVASAESLTNLLGLERRCVQLLEHPLLIGAEGSARGGGMRAARFKFEEGALIHAMKNGDWIVLDELNLAPADLLQRLRGLLAPSSANGRRPKFVLSENDGEEILIHPDFRIFGCMNPPAIRVAVDNSCVSQDERDHTDDNASMLTSAQDLRFRQQKSSVSAGKKELQSDIRQCFTEIFVDEIWDAADLCLVVSRLLPKGPVDFAPMVTQFYLDVRRLEKDALLSSQSGAPPQFSLRTLVRAARHAVAAVGRPWKPLRPLNAIVDGLLAHFATSVDDVSQGMLMDLIVRHFGVEKGQFLTCGTGKVGTTREANGAGKPVLEYAARWQERGILEPLTSESGVTWVPPRQQITDAKRDGKSTSVDVENLLLNASLGKELKERWLSIDGIPIRCGEDVIDVTAALEEMVVTSSVRRNLAALSRVLSGSRIPVLLEGPTSAGKSSLAKFLCRLTGHRFVRINNHEHTDVQEYLGQHVIDPETGQLVFVEGAIAEAARRGYWVVLDELNLAPSEVLEGGSSVGQLELCRQTVG